MIPLRRSWVIYSWVWGDGVWKGKYIAITRQKFVKTFGNELIFSKNIERNVTRSES